MIDYIVVAVLGLLVGFIFYKLSIVQISKRTEDNDKRNAFKKPVILIAWLLISSILFVAVLWREHELYKRLEYFIYISIVLNIAAVDYLIRKIPNELLLALMATKIIFTAISIVNGVPVLTSLFEPAIGLAVGFVLFSIPSMFKIMIGAGDVKFSAVIGFCLGYYMFLQAMVVMSVILLLYFVFLLITRKGNLKTKIAMGPYLAIGVVLTMIFPLTELMAK